MLPVPSEDEINQRAHIGIGRLDLEKHLDPGLIEGSEIGFVLIHSVEFDVGISLSVAGKREMDVLGTLELADDPNGAGSRTLKITGHCLDGLLPGRGLGKRLDSVMGRSDAGENDVARRSEQGRQSPDGRLFNAARGHNKKYKK